MMLNVDGEAILMSLTSMAAKTLLLLAIVLAAQIHILLAVDRWRESQNSQTTQALGGLESQTPKNPTARMESPRAPPDTQTPSTATPSPPGLEGDSWERKLE